MPAPTSYTDPALTDKPEYDFFERQDSLRMGRYPAIIGHFSQDRAALKADGTADVNVFGLPLYVHAPLGRKYSLLIDTSTAEGLNRLSLMMNAAADRASTYMASGSYPTTGMALEAAIADEWYALRDLALSKTTAADVAALGVVPQGDHPFSQA